MASPAAAAAAARAPSSHEVPTGGHESLEGLWGPLGAQAAQRSPLFSCPYPAIPCYSFLRPPPFCLLTQPAPPAPCELLAHGPLQLWPGPLLYSPLLQPGPGAPEDALLRAKAGPARESTAALKAWLGQHRKNPYPSKGEKVLLALVSRMSLTQVSTWFANARRRLKKENRASWARQPPKTEEEELMEEEEEEGTEEALRGEAAAAAHSSLRPKSRPPQGPPQGRAWGAEQGPRRRLPLGTTTTSTSSGRMDEPLPPKATIWCVAELATGPTPGRAGESDSARTPP